MYAVVKTGGKQYRVVPGDVIEVEKLPAEAGTIIELGEVLMLGGEGAPQIGAPRIEGAAVTATVLEQLRDDTILVFKKKRRHNYRRKRGHRQFLTVLRIAEILPPGATRTVTEPAVSRPRKAKPAAPVVETKTADEAAPKAATKKPAAKKAPAKKAAPKAAAKKAAPVREKKTKAPAKSGGAKKTTKTKKS